MNARKIVPIMIALLLLAPAGPAAGKKSDEDLLYGRLRRQTWDLFTIAAEGGEATRLTDTKSSESDAVYSPDGSRIAFHNDVGGDIEIFVMNADGTDVTQVTDGPFYKFFPEWSPDGSRLLYQASTDLETDSMIYVINADGTDSTRLTKQGQINTQGTWSPDGTKIAYDHSIPGSSDIYVMNPDGSDKTRLTEHVSFETFPSWSPDGTEILFSRYRQDTKSGGYDAWAVDLLGVERRLTRTRKVSEEFATYSPDGTLISYVKCRGTTCGILVTDGNGDNRRTIMPTGVEAGPPIWSPDSTRLAFSRFVEGPSQVDLFMVDAGSGSLTRLTETARADEYLYDLK